MQVRKVILPLFIFIITFFSCRKEKDATPLPPNLVLLKEIKDVQGKTVSRLKYDAAGRIVETENRDYYQRFYYNPKGQLIKQESAIDPNIFSSSTINQNNDIMTAATAVISTYTLYEYNQTEELTTAKYYHKQNGSFISTSRRSFEYNNDLITRVNIHDPQEKITQFRTYTYDSKGNVNEENYYSNSNPSAGTALQLIHSATFNYDSKKNPFQIFNKLGMPGLYTNPNNIIKVRTTSFVNAPGMPNNITTETIYQYNQANYPMKVDGAYQYFYK